MLPEERIDAIAKALRSEFVIKGLLNGRDLLMGLRIVALDCGLRLLKLLVRSFQILNLLLQRIDVLAFGGKLVEQRAYEPSLPC